MYNDYYGFKLKPFDTTPDPRFIFLNKERRELLSYLNCSIYERRGFISLVGDEGIGKTTLLNYLLSQFDNKNKTAIISVVDQEFEQLLDMIFVRVGIAQGRKIFNNIEKIRFLYEFALHQLDSGGNLILVLDEAHKLDYHMLENLRLLSNLETHKHKLFQIIFSGLPQFNLKLNHNQARSFAKRLSLKCSVSPFSNEETSAYIEHRLLVAGLKHNSLFNPDICRVIWKKTSGTPGKINNLCDHALMIGYETGKREISLEIVREAFDSNIQGLSPTFRLGLPTNIDQEYHSIETIPVKSRSWAGTAFIIMAGIFSFLILFLYYSPWGYNSSHAKFLSKLVVDKFQNNSAKKANVLINPIPGKIEDQPSQTNRQPKDLPGNLILKNIEPGVINMDNQRTEKSASTKQQMVKEKHEVSIELPNQPLKINKNLESSEEIVDGGVMKNPAKVNFGQPARSTKDPLSDKKAASGGYGENEVKVRPLTVSSIQKQLIRAIGKWGKTVYVRRGESLPSLIKRVYGIYHTNLLDAVLIENHGLKTISIRFGQAIKLPKSYAPPIATKSTVRSRKIGKAIKQNSDTPRKRNLIEYNDFIKKLEKKHEVEEQP